MYSTSIFTILFSYTVWAEGAHDNYNHNYRYWDDVSYDTDVVDVHGFQYVGYEYLASNNDMNIELNGNVINFDIAPFIMNDVTVVPIREIARHLGLDITLDSTTNTIVLYTGETFISQWQSLFESYNAVVLEPTHTPYHSSYLERDSAVYESESYISRSLAIAGWILVIAIPLSLVSILMILFSSSSPRGGRTRRRRREQTNT